MEKKLAPFNTALIIVLLLATAIGIAPVNAADPPPPGNLSTRIELPNYKMPGLDSSLVQLVKGQEKEQAAAVAQQLNIDFKDNKVRVTIETVPGKAAAAAALARSLGADVEITHEDHVQAMVPVAALTALAGSNIIKLVRRPYTSFPLAVSQGVSLINASAWQAAGYTGAGTKVGILDLGFSGYAALLGTDLPANVTAKSFRADNDITGGGEVHGTACAEVVYDVSPGAQFYLANYGTTDEYEDAVDWLISQGVNVISHSCGNYSGPGNGTGSSCTKVNDAHAAGITVAQSAGNQAQMHWGGTFNGDSNNYNKFSSTSNINQFLASAGQSLNVTLRWNDAWGASGNNYDLILIYKNGSTWQYVDSATDVQNGDDNPFENIHRTIPTTGQYGLVIKKVAATGNASMELMTYRHGLQYAVAAGSLIIPADSPNAITVGAVQWDTPTTITAYSSQGPTTDGRVKPDLVAPSHVSNVTYGTYSGGYTGFTGTSASAPHVAGAAVLVKNRYTTYTPAQIQSYLESNAVELGAAGKDNIFGSGRLKLPAPLSLPTITNASGATSVTATTATLNGNLTSTGGATTTVTVYWGTTDGVTTPGSWGHNVPLEAKAMGAFLTDITGLSDGTTYYYRCSATNAAGTSWAESSASFVTTAIPTVTLNAKVSAATDDILARKYKYGGEYWWTVSTGATVRCVGNYANDYRNTGSGFRFQNIAIPAGRTVKSARLKVTSYQSWSDTAVNTIISGQLAANPPTFAGTYTDYSAANRPRTSAATHWDNIPAWTAGTVYYSPDVTGVIQELINQPSWASGNSVVIFWEDDGSSGWQWETRTPARSTYSYGLDPAKTLELEIVVYDTAAPTVSTSTATSVTATTATLNGTLTSNGGEDCQYSFCRGTSPGVYTDNTTWMGSKITGQSFSANITGLVSGMKYYFIAQCKNSAGTGTGLEKSFTTCTKTGSPTLTSPVHGATVAGTSVTFTWAAGTGSPTKYWLEINSSNTWGAGTRIYYADVGNVLSKTVTTLPANGSTLYWRVQPYNACGWGSWSLTRNFINAVACTKPGAPTLASPANAGTVSGTSGTFTWTAGTGTPTKYWLQVNTNSAFTGTNKYYAQVNGTSQLVSGLPANGSTLYWRVQAGNTCGWSPWSTSRSFTNSAACTTPPGAPTLSSPANAGTVSGTSGTFTWAAGTGTPTKYWLEVNSSNAWGSATRKYYADVGNVLSKTVTTLPANGSTLYWRVQPYNACGWGTWSASRSFINGP